MRGMILMTLAIMKGVAPSIQTLLR